MTQEPHIPAFQRIKNLILESIQTGVWKQGQAIPSELALAKQFGVSRMTVNRAMRELTQEQAKEEPKTVERPHESAKKFEPEPKPEEFRVKKLVSIPVGLSEKAKKIYESMGEEPLFADEIAAKTGFAPWEVVSSMTELELEDLVCLCAGKRYKKI